MNALRCRTLTALILIGKKEAEASLLLKPFCCFSAKKNGLGKRLAAVTVSLHASFLFGLTSHHSLPIPFTILLLPPTSRDSPISTSSAGLSGHLARDSK